LHAAGKFAGGQQVNLSDYAVSSYTPSLTTLLKARRNFSPVPRTILKALLVAEPNAPGLDFLSEVGSEVKIAHNLVCTNGGEVINDINSTSSVESTLRELPNAHIFHLACHGIQHPNDPLQSHFALHDGSLSISALTKLDLKNAVFALLSACETAQGDKNQPDQAVHLAASLLFCGFRSVIATLW
jgi:CHAT domain-containing protein